MPGINEETHQLKMQDPDYRYVRIDTQNPTLDEVSAFADALRANQSVEILEMLNCRIDDEKIAVLAQAIAQNNSLININFEANYITDQGMIILANALKDKKNLIALRIGGNQITEVSIKKIISVLKNNPIQVFSIHTTSMGDRGVEMITDALMGSPHLVSLNLSCTQMSVTGVTAISALLKSCENLYELVLNSYSTNNEGLALIANALSQHKRLAVLDIGLNREIDDEGYTALSRSLSVNKSLILLRCSPIAIKTLTDIFTKNTSLLNLVISADITANTHEDALLAMITEIKKQDNHINLSDEDFEFRNKKVRTALKEIHKQQDESIIPKTISATLAIQLIRSYRIDSYTAENLAKAVQTLEDNLHALGYINDEDDYRSLINSLIAFRFSITRDHIIEHGNKIMSFMDEMFDDEDLDNIDDAHYIKKFIQLIRGKVDALNEGNEKAQRRAVVDLMSALETPLLRDEASDALILLLNNGIIGTYLTEETKEKLDYLLLDLSIEAPGKSDLMMFALNAYARLNQLSEPSYEAKIELCKKPEERIKEFKTFIEKQAAVKQTRLTNQGLFAQPPKPDTETAKTSSPRSSS